LKAPLHRLRLLITGIFICLSFSGISIPLCGAGDTHVIKAAYLRNAFNFARWPGDAFASSTSRFEIGFVGKDEKLENSLRLAFEKLQYRVQDRSVRLTHHDTPEEFLESQKNNGTSCHVLFLSSTEKESLKSWVQACEKKPVLLISDHPDFQDFGGHVWITPNPKAKGRYIYNVHLPNLKSCNLRFTAEFLRLRSAVNVISK